jgi:hypothetical protein
MQYSAGACPVCDEPYGRVELIGAGSRDQTKYWHTDLVERQRYCIVFDDGQEMQVRDGVTVEL